MHELSIAEQLLQIIFKNAAQAGIKKVYSINLRIGEHSGIVPDSLEFAFEVLSRGKITEGARLHIEKTSPVFKCSKCGWEDNHMDTDYSVSWTCPNCGEDEVYVQGGDDLEIVSFEGDQ